MVPYGWISKLWSLFWGTLNIRGRIIIGTQKGTHNFDNHPYIHMGICILYVYTYVSISLSLSFSVFLCLSRFKGVLGLGGYITRHCRYVQQ